MVRINNTGAPLPVGRNAEQNGDAQDQNGVTSLPANQATKAAPATKAANPNKTATANSGSTNSSINYGAGVREDIRKALAGDALETKKKLSKEPVVSILVPLGIGEKINQAEHYVAINGYGLYIKKGYMVSLPKSMAEIVIRALNIQGELFLDKRIDLKTANDQERLS